MDSTTQLSTGGYGKCRGGPRGHKTQDTRHMTHRTRGATGPELARTHGHDQQANEARGIFLCTNG